MDIHYRGVNSRGENHKRFCSTYVQLLQVQLLQSMSLLEPIQLSDIGCMPHLALQVEDKKLDKLRDKNLETFIKAYQD